MSVLKVRIYPDPVLKQVSEPVDDFGPETQAFFDNLIETMYTDDGVGLAAPQVGVLKRVLIASPKMKPGTEEVIVNPEILESRGRELGQEGCLSFPGVAAEVWRAKKIRLCYQDRRGEKREVEIADFYARIVQHEMDHLNGILLIDQVDFDTRQALLAQYPA